MTPELKELLDDLAPLQRKVALNVVAGMSNIDAYYEAGGKASTKESAEATVSEILRNPKVKIFLDAANKTAINDAVMSRQEMMERLSNLGRANINDLVEWYENEPNEDGSIGVKQSVWYIKPSAMQDPDKMAIISELNASKDGIKIKTHSQLAAMQQLARLAGYESAQKHDLTSSDGTMTPAKPDTKAVAEAISSIADKL